MEEFEYLGEWWLPNSHERRRAGILRFSRDNGLRLTLIGTLDAQKDDEGHLVVLGWAGEVREITLVRCFHTKLREGKSEYVADSVFLGSHLESTDSRRFQSIDIEYSQLLDWVGVFGLSRTIRSGPVGAGVDMISYHQPESIEFDFSPVEVKTPIHAVISFGAESINNRHERSLRQSCRVRFRADDSWTIGQWKQRVILPFRDFLTFATRVPNTLGKISLPVPDSQEPRLDDQGRRMRPINVVFQSDFGTDLGQQAREPELLLPYSKISDRCGAVLSSWTDLYATIDSVIGLFMPHYGQRGGLPSIHAKFINLVQAVESYHGRRRPSGKRPALFKRLSELVDEAELAKWGLVADEDKDQFIRGIVDTRNYYTHYSREYERKSLAPPALLDAMTVLETLLEVSLLGELGFSTEDAHTMTRSKERASSLGRWRVLEREP
jgi:ApeA N-terminal domain 1